MTNAAVLPASQNVTSPVSLSFIATEHHLAGQPLRTIETGQTP